MKHFKLISLPFLFLYLNGFTQVPPGYYDSATGLSGEYLKAALHNIIKGHVEFPYTSTATDTWDILKESDRDTANSENVILFYTGWSVNSDQEYNNGNGWSREHVWAKSHGDFGTTKGAGTDAHHLRPTDISVNTARNNKDFDNGGSLYIDGDGATECKSDADSWEPRIAVKGDVARMLFYMAVRYEGDNGEPDLELVDGVNTFDLNEPGKGFHGKLSTLIEWHYSDPVDSFERSRNDVVFKFQKNRNPFIDYPEFVEKIWQVTAVDEVVEKPFRIYPNPASSFIQIETEENVEGVLYSAEGRTILNFEVSGKFKLMLHNLIPGLYFIHIKTQNHVFKEKVIIGN